MNKQKLLILMAGLFLLALLSPVSANTIANFTGFDNDATSFEMDGSIPVAMNFTALNSAGIETLRIKVWYSGTVNSITATIRPQNSSGKWNSTIISMGTLAGSQLNTTANGSYVTINMSLAILESGRTYFIVMNNSGSGAVRWRANATSAGTNNLAYPPGSMLYSANQTHFPNFDMTFEINGTQNLVFPFLLLPAPEASISSSNVNFSARIDAFGSMNVTNATIFLYNPSGNLFNQTTNTITGTTNITNWSISGIDGLGIWKWNVLACGVNATASSCNFAANRTFALGAQDINTTFNATSHETSSETFTSLLTIFPSSTIQSALLYYKGTSYTATVTNTGGQNRTLSRTIDVPLGATTNDWNWIINFDGGFQQNLSVEEQTVSIINYTLCGAAPQNVEFINLEFKNETANEESVNATVSSSWVYWLGGGTVNKTLSYSSTTELADYSFCFTPAGKSMTTSATINYDNGESQQRTYSLSNSILTNSSTNQVLYLLPTDLGLFSNFQAIDTNGDPVSEVKATISRDLGGSTITVTSASTDDSGYVSFFLNPEVTYTAVFEKAGLETQTFTFVPSVDLRTVIMGLGSSPIGNGTTIAYGTSYTVTPSNSSLNNNTNYTFGFTVTSNQTITYISMNITNSSGHQVVFQENSGAGSLSEIFNTGSNTRLVGYYKIRTADEEFTFVKVWTVGQTYIGDYSIYRQFTLFNEYEFADFIRLLIAMAIISGLMIYLSTEELLDSSESKILVALLLIWGFSIVGWLDTGLIVNSASENINSLGELSSQYGIAILASAASAFFLLRRLFT